MAGWKLYLGLVGICAIAAGQDAVDLKAYDAFFLQVPDPAAAGQTALSARITPQAALGLTDQQADGLNRIARDLREKSVRFDSAIKGLVLETRLAAIGLEPPSPGARRELDELNRQRAQMVAEHIGQLKAILSAAEFRAVDGYIRSRTPDGPFFPPVVMGRATAVKAKSTPR